MSVTMRSSIGAARLTRLPFSGLRTCVRLFHVSLPIKISLLRMPGFALLPKSVWFDHIAAAAGGLMRSRVRSNAMARGARPSTYSR